MANKGGTPAKNSGNRVSPKLAGKIPMPPNFHSTYGKGEGEGGPGVAASKSGNRVQPKIANQVPLPSAQDSGYGSGGK